MSTINADVIQAINEGGIDLSSCWLWSSEPIYSQDYLEVYNQPVSIEVVTLAQIRFKADLTLLTIRSSNSDTSSVVYSAEVYLNPDPTIDTPSTKELQQISTGVVGSAAPNAVYGTGTISIESAVVNLYDNPTFLGEIKSHFITGNVFTLTDNTEEYIVADYNGGYPIYRLENNKFAINDSDVVLIRICWRQGDHVHSIDSDCQGSALANKIEAALISTTPYRKSVDGGMVMTETSTPSPRTILISSSLVFAASTPHQILAFNSSINEFTFVRHVAGVWTYSDVLVYNNADYDNGTNLVAIGNNKYGVVWVYRSIGSDIQSFFVLGDTDYTSIQHAQLSKMRSDLPLLLRDHCMLVGRIIIQKGATSGLVENVADITFTTAQVTNHNDLGNIQGVGPEYYHLSNTQYGLITSGGNTTLHYHATDRNRANHTGTQSWATISAVPVASTSTSGVLSSSNWNTFNNKQAALTSASNVRVGSLSATSVSATSISATSFVGTFSGLASSSTSAFQADKLKTGRTIGITGDITYTSPTFDGTTNITGVSTLASVGTAGTYTKVTTDAKGRVTAGTSLIASDIPNLDASKITSGTIDPARIPVLPSQVPQVTTNIPALSVAQQNTITSGTIVTTSDDGFRYVYSGVGSKTTSASYIVLADITPEWSAISNRPTNVSYWTNDAGYLTSNSSLAWAKLTSIPTASTSTSGVLTSTDWNTFNNKQGFITAGTSAQYFRGDKTWQTLNTSIVPELTNLYYTQARFDTAFSGKSTTNLAEGTNLYYTNARVKTYADTLYLPLTHSIGSTDLYSFTFTEGTNTGSLNLNLLDDNDGSESFRILNAAGNLIAGFYSNRVSNFYSIQEDGVALSTKYATSASLANYVTLDTTQSITGAKTFTSNINIGKGSDTSNYTLIYFDTERPWRITKAGTGGSTQLHLIESSGNKQFVIGYSSDGVASTNTTMVITNNNAAGTGGGVTCNVNWTNNADVNAATLRRNGFTVWDAGNLVGTRNEHNHTGVYQPAGNYQTLDVNLSALSTSATNSPWFLASIPVAGNMFSDTLVGDVALRWGAPYTEKVRLGVMSNSSGNNASSIWFSASAVGFNYPITGTTATFTTVTVGSGIILNGAGVGGRYLSDGGSGVYLAVNGVANTGKTVYLETYDTDVYHRKNGTDYKLWDAGNFIGTQNGHNHTGVYVDITSTQSITGTKTFGNIFGTTLDFTNLGGNTAIIDSTLGVGGNITAGSNILLTGVMRGVSRTTPNDGGTTVYATSTGTSAAISNGVTSVNINKYLYSGFTGFLGTSADFYGICNDHEYNSGAQLSIIAGYTTGSIGFFAGAPTLLANGRVQAPKVGKWNNTGLEVYTDMTASKKIIFKDSTSYIEKTSMMNIQSESTININGGTVNSSSTWNLQGPMTIPDVRDYINIHQTYSEWNNHQSLSFTYNQPSGGNTWSASFGMTNSNYFTLIQNGQDIWTASTQSLFTIHVPVSLGTLSAGGVSVDNISCAPPALSGGTDYATATNITKMISKLITGPIGDRWFKFPAASSSSGRIITIISTSATYGAYLVSVSGTFLYKDGSSSFYNNPTSKQTFTSIWTSDGTSWYEVG